MMDPKTEKALRDSIAHWRKTAAVTSHGQVTIGVRYCALCSLFNHEGLGEDKPSCVGCPVYQESGLQYCKGTPFTDAAHSLALKDLATFKKDARREVEFLESLLPKETK